MEYKKIAIVGISCSGKTTLGRKLEKRLGIAMTDLDDLYWLPGWVRRDPDELMAEIDQLTQGEQWILVGDYRQSNEMVFSRADLLIWLDVPLPLLLWRGIKRAFNLAWHKTPICNGNIAGIGRLFGRESILYFIVKGYRRKRPRYQALMDKQEQLPYRLIRLSSGKELPLPL